MSSRVASCELGVETLIPLSSTTLPFFSKRPILYLTTGSSMALGLLIPASTVGLGVHCALPSAALLAGLGQSFSSSTFESLYTCAVLSLGCGLVPSLALGILTATEFTMLVLFLGFATASTRSSMIEEREKRFVLRQNSRLRARKRKEEKKKKGLAPGRSTRQARKDSTRLAISSMKSKELQGKRAWGVCLA